MGFDALCGFHVHSASDNTTDYVECSHCGERVFDRTIDTMDTVKRVVNFFVAHLGMYHPEELPPDLIS